MRIIAFSDSHTNITSCCSILNKITGVDMVLHAGDHASDAIRLSKLFPNLDIRFVKGNCDAPDAPNELIFEAEGKKIFLTHGHCYSVKEDFYYATIKEKALLEGADIVVFGHTHIPINDNMGSLILLNPGSIKFGRTFAIIEIEDGKISTDICDSGLWL